MVSMKNTDHFYFGNEKNKELLEKTIALWQPFYPYQLTAEDAEEVINNIRTFFLLLSELQEKEEKSFGLDKSNSIEKTKVNVT